MDISSSDSSTDQNQNYSQISSDESFSSRLSSTLSYEQPEYSNKKKISSYQNPLHSQLSKEYEVNDLENQNITCHDIAERHNHVSKMHSQQFCRDSKSVDWEDVKRKLALPYSADVSQQLNMFQSEIMDRKNSTRKNNGTYQMTTDEILCGGLDPRGNVMYDNEEIFSTSQFSEDMQHIYGRYPRQRNLSKYNMVGAVGHLHQDVKPWELFASKRYKYKYYTKPRRTGKTWAEEDMFSDDLTKKPKYRLLLNPAMRLKLEKEFPMYAHDLELTIQVKFLSLRIPVEVSAYTRLDKHRTSDKTFTVTFQSSSFARAALQLIEQGRLDFRMNEARPSPRYHVKFIVLCRVSVYEGKCFSRRVRELQNGDIVTANQERGNKLRIIRHCPCGSNVQHELKGWVLLQTKEKELLRRIELVDGEIVMKERRFSFMKKPASQQISSKCVPFRALDQVHVYSGNKEPSSTVIDQLNPGAVVYGDKVMRSMLRIIKTDVCGNIQLGHNAEPQPYGWVMLRRIEDGQPQFEFVPRIRKNSERGTTNHGEYLNHFYRSLLKENELNNRNCENIKKQIMYSMTEELSRGNSFLSYNDVMSMVNPSPASNSVSSMRKVHPGASYNSDKIFGSMRSESHSPVTTSSIEQDWLAALEKQANRVERDRFSLNVDSHLH